MSSNRANDVGGTTEFRDFFNSLDDSDPLKKDIRAAQNVLQEDRRAGEKIEHKKWPKKYRKMKVTNLWRFRLGSGGRIIYTILSDSNGFVVSLMDAFRTHKEYEQEFEY